jgi:PmbA protein
MVDVRSIAENLLRMVERSGADEGEAYVRASHGMNLSLRDQEIDRLRTSRTAGYGLRVILDGRVGFVHSSDFAERSMEDTVARAVNLARISEPDEANALSDPSGETPSVEIEDPDFEAIPFERKLDLLKDVETLSFACDPAISAVEYLGYSDSAASVALANTRGLMRVGRSTRYAVSVSVVAEAGDEVETGGEESESRFFGDLFTPSEMASRACSRAVSLLGGKPVATQTVPVVFDCSVAYALLRHFFEMINGSRVAEGVSVLKDRLGDRIASPLVGIVDDPTIDGGMGSRSFDGEGTPTSRTEVLRDGVLDSFLFDTRSARKAGSATTGNAVRSGFRDLPGVGSTNFILQKGTTSPEEMLASTDRGLWVKNLAGWWVGINSATGDFSSGARGLWIENGQVVHPVKNVTIASNILDMLGAVDAVGDDLEIRFPTIGPSFRVSEMRLGGV